MRFEVARPLTHPELAKFIASGSTAGCPFCAAREEPPPRLGSQVTLMNGRQTGISGIVVDGGPHFGIDRVAVELDPPFRTRPGFRVFAPNRDLLSCRPLPVPTWLAPLSTEDLANIDEAVLLSLNGAIANGELQCQSLFPIINTVWQLRLPVRGDDLAETFAMHGLPLSERQAAIEVINFGIDLLVWSHRRRRIKRRRMPPMSQPYYEPTRSNPELSQLITSLRGRHAGTRY